MHLLITIFMQKLFSTLQPDSTAPSFHRDCDKPFELGFNIMNTKECKICKTIKPIKKFVTSHGCIGGRSSVCHDCKGGCKGVVPFDISNLDNEIWIPVLSMEGYFVISNYFRIKRLPRKFKDASNRTQNLREKITKQYKCKSTGYIMVNMNVNGQEYRTTTHRLIAIHFIPNPLQKKEVNHKNGVRDDNSISNLEWVTPSENIKHSFSVLKRKPPVPYSKNPQLAEKNIIKSVERTSKPVLQINFNGEVIKKHSSLAQAVREGAGKCSSAISKCCKGKISYHNNFIWKYA